MQKYKHFLKQNEFKSFIRIYKLKTNPATTVFTLDGRNRTQILLMYEGVPVLNSLESHWRGSTCRFVSACNGNIGTEFPPGAHRGFKLFPMSS